MSIKSFIQILILSLIILIVGSVYYRYFETEKNIVKEINSSNSNNNEQLKELKEKISELELQNKKLNEKINNNKVKTVEISTKTIEEEEKIRKNKDLNIKETENENIKIQNKDKPVKKILKKNEIKNLVKDVEYTSVDQKGNRFNLLANSGKSNVDNNNILDLENVRGEIKSDKRDTIYIVSDFAMYNISNLNSKFYKNVIIEYQDKKITCENFNINMEINKAIAYNNVKITDTNSIMNAGIVEFDLATKDININPDNITTEIEVITN